jgi:hypothetical protein
MTFKNNAKPNVWRSGWPPFTGWWQMTRSGDEEAWRWVDLKKKTVSYAVYADYSLSRVLELSQISSNDIDIRAFIYRDYWPVNARVDRVAPKGLR